MSGCLASLESIPKIEYVEYSDQICYTVYMSMPILSDVETHLIRRLNTSELALIASKIAHPNKPLNELAKYVFPDLTDKSIDQLIYTKELNKAYKLIINNPWIAGQLMLTSLYPYAIGTLLNISANEDERSNVRVTAAKELIRLGGYAEQKLAQANESARVPTSDLSTLFSSTDVPEPDDEVS